MLRTKSGRVHTGHSALSGYDESVVLPLPTESITVCVEKRRKGWRIVCEGCGLEWFFKDRQDDADRLALLAAVLEHARRTTDFARQVIDAELHARLPKR